MADSGGLTRCGHFLIGSIRLRIAKVRGDGVVKQVWILGDEANRATKAVLGEIANIGTVDSNRPARDVVQASDE